jgi:hypothetical protein
MGKYSLIRTHQTAGNNNVLKSSQTNDELDWLKSRSRQRSNLSQKAPKERGVVEGKTKLKEPAIFDLNDIE